MKYSDESILKYIQSLCSGKLEDSLFVPDLDAEKKGYNEIESSVVVIEFGDPEDPYWIDLNLETIGPEHKPRLIVTTGKGLVGYSSSEEYDKRVNIDFNDTEWRSTLYKNIVSIVFERFSKELSNNPELLQEINEFTKAHQFNNGEQIVNNEELVSAVNSLKAEQSKNLQSKKNSKSKTIKL